MKANDITTKLSEITALRLQAQSLLDQASALETEVENLKKNFFADLRNLPEQFGCSDPEAFLALFKEALDGMKTPEAPEAKPEAKTAEKPKAPKKEAKAAPAPKATAPEKAPSAELPEPKAPAPAAPAASKSETEQEENKAPIAKEDLSPQMQSVLDSMQSNLSRQQEVPVTTPEITPEPPKANGHSAHPEPKVEAPKPEEAFVEATATRYKTREKAIFFPNVRTLEGGGIRCDGEYIEVEAGADVALVKRPSLDKERVLVKKVGEELYILIKESRLDVAKN